MQQLSDAGQIRQSLGVRENVLPAIGEIVAVAARVDPGLHIKAQQLETPCVGRERRRPGDVLMVCVTGYGIDVLGTGGRPGRRRQALAFLGCDQAGLGLS